MLGVLAVIGASIFEIDFIESKHLFGLGIGMIVLGVGFWKSYKTFSHIRYGGILSWKDYRYDIVSIVLIVFGLGLTGLFAYHIIKGLL